MTFVRLLAVTVAADGSATLTGNPTTVHCGGPDDLQYLPGASTETVQLVAGGSVGIFSLTTMGDTPLPVGQLSAYLAKGPESGIFQVQGSLPAATGIAEIYHP
jgi:hypothetical protein